MKRPRCQGRIFGVLRVVHLKQALAREKSLAT